MSDKWGSTVIGLAVANEQNWRIWEGFIYLWNPFMQNLRLLLRWEMHGMLWQTDSGHNSSEHQAKGIAIVQYLTIFGGVGYKILSIIYWIFGVVQCCKKM